MTIIKEFPVYPSINGYFTTTDKSQLANSMNYYYGPIGYQVPSISSFFGTKNKKRTSRKNKRKGSKKTSRKNKRKTSRKNKRKCSKKRFGSYRELTPGGMTVQTGSRIVPSN